MSGKREVIYIAGPISGTSDYMDRFKQAESVIREANAVPINPTIISSSLLEAKADYSRFMSVTRELLKCCNGIYLLNGWEYSAGAKEELKYALNYDYNVYTEHSLGGENESENPADSGTTKKSTSNRRA